MRLRVWLDYACPFCYIGHGLVDRFRDAYPDVPVEWRGFELHPEIPVDGMPLEQVVPYAADRERVLAHLTRVADAAGVPPPALVPALAVNTRRAHHAAEWVREHAPDALDAFHRAVLRAYWERAENVAEAAVLQAAAREAGVLEVDGLRDALAGALPSAPFRDAAEAAGVTGVPTFDVLGARVKRRVVGVPVAAGGGGRDQDGSAGVVATQPFDVIAQTVGLVRDADGAAEEEVNA